jgi:hypothetical protein
MEKVHELNEIGGCTCGVFGCRRWREKFPKIGEEKRCPTCLKLMTQRERLDGSFYLWCLDCSAR